MKLLDDIHTEAMRLQDQATGYRMQGATEVARDMQTAALDLLQAERSLERAMRSMGEELSRRAEA